MGTAIKHPVPSFAIIFNIWGVRVPGLAQDALLLYPYGNSGHQRVNTMLRCIQEYRDENGSLGHWVCAGPGLDIIIG